MLLGLNVKSFEAIKITCLEQHGKQICFVNYKKQDISYKMWEIWTKEQSKKPKSGHVDNCDVDVFAERSTAPSGNACRPVWPTC